MSRRCHPLWAGTLAVALAACAPDHGETGKGSPASLPGPSRQAVEKAPAAGPDKPVLRRTPLPRYVEIVGPKGAHAPPFLGVPQTNFYLLRSWLDRQTGAATTQLYVTDSYSGGERVWEAAHDGAGASLPFVPILRQEITCEAGCAWEEEFAATLPQSLLEAAGDGLAVTFTARSGASKTIRLSPARVRGQLAALAAARARLLPDGVSGAGSAREAGRAQDLGSRPSAAQKP